ncbi:hypothetical protein HJG60_011809 [Phyllostomus discolor]|uniref:Uncharacterized protein n=1 Tax=Phyllostomus discolor TaxID=89673 RepID=A0A834DWD3_9CHIR|nr:hypothetical protein HJG60_011809 [Phyllostomus discolor]
MTPALRCACALALLCLVMLLQGPEGALGEETQLQQPGGLRAAYWLSTFGQFNKYFGKLFHGSSKSKDTKKSQDVKNPKKTANSTKIPSANATNPPPSSPARFPPRNSTTPPPRNTTEPGPPISS